MQRDYTTRRLFVSKTLPHEHVPQDSPMVGTRLRFDYGIERILTEIMDAVGAVTSAGRFEQAGLKLVRSFLDLLTMMPPRDVREELVGARPDGSRPGRRDRLRADQAQHADGAHIAGRERWQPAHADSHRVLAGEGRVPTR